jgi:hypothetical protein
MTAPDRGKLRRADRGAAALFALFAGCAGPPTTPPPAPTPSPAAGAAPAADEPWRPLFDGSTLAHWTSVAFGGEGSVHIDGGRLILEPGSPLTGVLADQELPASYELDLLAARLLGNDFFCGLTFPVADAHLTLVLGGWGGAVCGLSSLDGLDAAHNDTRHLRAFARGAQIAIRVRVEPERVSVALDGVPFLDCDLHGRALSLRAEMEPCRGLAIASYATRASIARCAWRPLAPGGDGAARIRPGTARGAPQSGRQEQQPLGGGGAAR